MKHSRIIIDPGHQGKDPGAVHPSGKPTEASLVLPFASMLGQALKLMGHDVEFTPAVGLPKSEVIRAGERARYANQLTADLLVSIHANACESHKGIGSEVWYCTHRELAEDMAEAISLGENRNRGAKQSNTLSILSKTDMPAILLELGFIDNDTDKDWLLKHWPAQVGAAAMVIHKYLEGFK